MGLTEKIFGKALDAVSLEDLKYFFSEEREENQILEFKSGDIKIADLYKEICAFLNTDGGVIIVGAPRERKMDHGDGNRKICQGDLTPSAFKGKAWIEQRIATTIVPFPEGIRIKEFSNRNSRYYIFDVPKSPKSPHQFKSDGRYYMRLNEEAKPAPHEVVKLLFLKNEKPVITLDIKFSPGEADNRTNLALIIKNKANVPLNKFHCKIEIININELVFEEMEHFFVDKNFTMEQHYNEVLIDELYKIFQFDLLHRYQPFVVYVIVTGSFGIKKRSIIYDPSNRITMVDSEKVGGIVTGVEEVKQQLDEMLNLLY